jgi:hypothetical protein
MARSILINKLGRVMRFMLVSHEIGVPAINKAIKYKKC